MQPECNNRSAIFLNLLVKPKSRFGALALLLLLFAATGCEQTVSTIDPPPDQPNRTKKLKIYCAPGVSAPLIQQYANEWKALQAVEIDLLAEPAGADIVIVSSAELPALAESGRFLPVPPDIRGRDHFLQWDNQLRNYAEHLSSWRGAAYGIPLLGAGRVLVYRVDRFEQAGLKPPETWEDFVAAAKALNRPRQPSLPGLPASALDLETQFHVIAACYDRPAEQQSETGVRIPDAETTDRLYSYHYRLKTGEPRINAPAFRHAFKLLREMQPCRAAAKADPLTDFLDGSASLAVIDLKDLARLQLDPTKKVRGKFGIGPVPGARFTFDLDDTLRPAPANTVNRMPYLGVGDWMGLVSKECANPAMAFEFLAGFAHPETMGAEIIMAAKWGAGPLRSSQTDERARGLWLGYDLSPEDTKTLMSALKQHVASSLVNPRYRLRLPNQQAHLDQFDRIVRPALTAENADGKQTLNAVADAWKKLWDGVPEQKKQAWLRRIHGL